MPVSDKARLLTVPQAAERLGLTVSGLRFWIYRRAIPYVRVGRAVRISEETIQRIIERGTVPALEDRA